MQTDFATLTLRSAQAAQAGLLYAPNVVSLRSPVISKEKSVRTRARVIGQSLVACRIMGCNGILTDFPGQFQPLTKPFRVAPVFHGVQSTRVWRFPPDTSMGTESNAPPLFPECLKTPVPLDIVDNRCFTHAVTNLRRINLNPQC
jgi:hypothetical protein